MTDRNKLTTTELHAVQSLINAVKGGHDDDAKFWADRPALLSALAKMRAQAKSGRN